VPPAEPLSLLGLEFSLDTASLDSLERVTRALRGTAVDDGFLRFLDTEEVALLTTCHRAELVLLTRTPEEVERWREILPGARSSWVLREERDAVRHLFRVAAGLESLAVGEGEVAHQVRAAGYSVRSRHPRPVLRSLFESAVDAAEETHRANPEVVPSIARAAVDRLRELTRASRPRLVVVGSGTVGRQVADAASSFADVTVVYHQRAPNEELLRRTRARAVPFSSLAEELRTADAVVTAAKFGECGLRAADFPHDHPMVLIDLGMPRNIDPDVRAHSNVRLVDLEELHARSPRAALPDGSDVRVERLADRCANRLTPLLLEPWIDAYRRSAEEVRRAELASARSFLGSLDPDQEFAVERLTQRLVARLLAAPTERIRSLPPGPDGDLQRRWAVDLLRPRPADL
jgi:glutamyl-tRNA reductase